MAHDYGEDTYDYRELRGLRKQHPDLTVYQTHSMLYASEEPGKVMEISEGLGRSKKYLFALLTRRKGPQVWTTSGERSHDYALHYSVLGAPEAATHATHDTFLVKACCQANGRRAKSCVTPRHSVYL